MKIRMNSTAAGPSGCMDSGKEYVVDDKLGAGMVAAGSAVNLDAGEAAEKPSARKVEEATREAPETAAGKGKAKSK